MSRDNEVYHFCVESIKFAYKIIGYDALVKELNFIHHIHQHDNQTAHIQNNTNNIVSKDLSEEKLAAPSVKQIVIENDAGNHKYARKNICDDFRCKAEIGKGDRCSFKRVDGGEFCSRHGG